MIHRFLLSRPVDVAGQIFAGFVLVTALVVLFGAIDVLNSLRPELQSLMEGLGSLRQNVEEWNYYHSPGDSDV